MQSFVVGANQISVVYWGIYFGVQLIVTPPKKDVYKSLKIIGNSFFVWGPLHSMYAT